MTPRVGLSNLLTIAALVSAVVAAPSVSTADAETPCPVVSPEARALGIDVVNEPACGLTPPDPSLGCVSSHCRYCQSQPTPYSFQYYPCSSSPVTIAPTPTEPPAQPPSAKCVALVPPAVAAAGLSAADDVTCIVNSMGCISARCRMCRISNSAVGLDAFQSCAELRFAVAQPSTCGMQVSESQAEMGVTVITDTSCVEGRPGCLGICRYCKLPQSTVTGLDFCPLAIASAVATATPPTVTAPVDTPMPTSLGTDPVTGSCGVSLPAAQRDVGLDTATDNSCANLGVNALFGCFNPSCRLCKRFDSEYTGDLSDCDAVSSLIGDTTGIPASVSDNVTNVTTIDSTDNSTVVAPVCSLPSPPGASEIGVFVMTDFSCTSNTSTGFGCLSAACRLCKVYDSALTASLPFCTAVPVDMSAAQDVEPIARSDDGTKPNTVLEDGDGEGSGDVSCMLSASGMIAVVLATAIVSTIAMVEIKRMLSRRAQRQLEQNKPSHDSGHIAV